MVMGGVSDNDKAALEMNGKKHIQQTQDNSRVVRMKNMMNTKKPPTGLFSIHDTKVAKKLRMYPVVAKSMTTQMTLPMTVSMRTFFFHGR